MELGLYEHTSTNIEDKFLLIAVSLNSRNQVNCFVLTKDPNGIMKVGEYYLEGKPHFERGFFYRKIKDVNLINLLWGLND